MAQTSSNQNYGYGTPQLSQEQQKLLLQALISRNERNQSNSYSSTTTNLYNSPSPIGVDPSVLNASNTQNQTSSSNGGFGDATYSSYNNGGFTSSELDYSFEADNSLGFSDSMTGLPNVSDGDGNEHEKRKKSVDEDGDDSDSDGEGSGKRREGEDKTAKKPGRKPLTTEPTTKRKAQNRAAQRAFRDRKEKHLKDLEQKVTDLEKASESANHENGLLRAQVNRLHNELRDYRKRLSMASASSRSPTAAPFASFQDPSTNVHEFQFDYTKFGNTPSGPLFNSNNNVLSGFDRSNSLPNTSAHQSLSPESQANGNSSTSSYSNQTVTRMTSLSPHSQASGLGGLFSPTILSSLGDYGFPTTESPPSMPNSTNSGRANSVRQQSMSQSISTSASPSASSNSHQGPVSSAGTSPEPLQNSPATKANGTPGANIKTEASKTPAQSSASDFSFDWLASQNGGQFDPVLFGDYRESQDAIVGGGEFSGGLFEDTFADYEQFFNPSADTNVPAPTEQLSLLEQTEHAKECNAKDDELVVPGDESHDYMSCHRIWDKLQSCPTFQSGEFDIDNLCTELQAKARCSESGVVVPKKDVEAALWKLANAPQQALQAPRQQPNDKASS